MKYLLILSLLFSISAKSQSFPTNSSGKTFFDKCLYIVDGVRKKGHPLGNIKAENISRIEVLSNAEAKKRYGRKGRYGAILITTKHQQ